MVWGRKSGLEWGLGRGASLGARDVPGGIALEARTRGHTSGLSKGKGKDLSMDTVLDAAICFDRIRTTNPVPWRSMLTAFWHWYVCPGVWDYCIFSDPVALLNFLLPAWEKAVPLGVGDALGSTALSKAHMHMLSSTHTWYSPLVCLLSLGQPEP